MSDLPDTVDVAIIGSGIGGSTIAYGLAGSGARIAILERGFHLGAHPAARDATHQDAPQLKGLLADAEGALCRLTIELARRANP